MNESFQSTLRQWAPAQQRPGAARTSAGAVPLAAVVRFDGSEPLIRLLATRGIRVKVFDSLPAAIAESRALNSAVLVARLPLELCDDRGPITLVIRNSGTPGVYEERFHERFVEFFSGPVDPTTLCSAVIGRAGLPDEVAQRRPGWVA